MQFDLHPNPKRKANVVSEKLSLFDTYGTPVVPNHRVCLLDLYYKDPDQSARPVVEWDKHVLPDTGSFENQAFWNFRAASSNPALPNQFDPSDWDPTHSRVSPDITWSEAYWGPKYTVRGSGKLICEMSGYLYWAAAEEAKRFMTMYTDVAINGLWDYYHEYSWQKAVVHGSSVGATSVAPVDQNQMNVEPGSEMELAWAWNFMTTDTTLSCAIRSLNLRFYWEPFQTQPMEGVAPTFLG